MGGSAWKISTQLHEPECLQKGRDIKTLYIRETINRKQRFVPMGAYCTNCGTFEVDLTWESQNDRKFEVVRRRIPREYSTRINL